MSVLGFAVDLLLAWGIALAVSLDLVVLLAALARPLADPRRPLAAALVTTVITRSVVPWTGLPGLAMMSMLFGLGALLLGWHLYHHGDPPARLAIPAAALVGVVLGATACAGSGAGPVAVSCASLVALAGVPQLVRALHRWARQLPELVVGQAVLIVLIGVKSALAGFFGRLPVEDGEVLMLSVGLTALVAGLCVVTAQRVGR